MNNHSTSYYSGTVNAGEDLLLVLKADIETYLGKSTNKIYIHGFTIGTDVGIAWELSPESRLMQMDATGSGNYMLECPDDMISISKMVPDIGGTIVYMNYFYSYS